MDGLIEMNFFGRYSAFLLLVVVLLGGCATLPSPQQAPTQSYAISDGESTSLGKLAARDAPAPGSDLSGFHLLPGALLALDARIALVRRAERSIDIQYLVLRNDQVGLLLLRELRDAASRGVRVRLLVDDLYAGGQDELFASLAALPMVEVRLFNPLPSRARQLSVRLSLSIFHLLRINHRMHNKLLVVDNSFAVTGGRNIGNDYFMRDTSANFIDLDVISSGPVVREMSKIFDRFWNSEQAWPIGEIAPLDASLEEAQKRFADLVRSAAPEPTLAGSRDAFHGAPVSEQLASGRLDRHWARARVYADSPDKLLARHKAASEVSVVQGALDAIANAQRETKIVSPYFIPGSDGMAVLEDLVTRGRLVAVITNSQGSTDEPLAYAGYERYRMALLRAGVTIYEVAPEGKARTKRFGDFGQSLTRLHAKVALIDDDRLFIGSMNLDHRSAAINTELGVLIDSRELVAEVNRLITAEHVEFGYRLRLTPDGKRAQWLSHDDEGSHVVHEEEPGSLAWQRLKSWLLLQVVGEELL